jgi:hypothetical protein
MIGLHTREEWGSGEHFFKFWGDPNSVIKALFQMMVFAVLHGVFDHLCESTWVNAVVHLEKLLG